MEDVCDKCGMPKNICVCGEIAKESQKIKIMVMRRQFGKIVTVVRGLEDEKSAKQLGKELKRVFACGGTSKGTEIELQGDHKMRVKDFLLKQGYKGELINA